MKNINFVYFDLGGVAILDFSGTNKWFELKKELGITTEKEKQFRDFWKKYETELCIGKKDAETLLVLMKEQLNVEVPDNYSLLIDGFVNRFVANKSIWPVIDKIHKDCKIGLLTNAYPEMLNAVKERGILPNVRWDVIVDSSVVGLRKPDFKIYRTAQKETGVTGKEILFVDNSSENIEAAKDLGGWQTFLYDSSKAKDSSRRLSELWSVRE